MTHLKQILFVMLVVTGMLGVFLREAHAQEAKQAKKAVSETQDVSEKDFQEAKRFLLGKKFATEQQIERAVKSRGKAAVVRYAQGKGWKGGSGKGSVPARGAKRERKPNCLQTSVGLTPLNELGNGRYKDQQGGLYGSGKNVPPEKHLQAGLKRARQMTPLDRQGKPDLEQGKIVLLSIGMSNTTQEFRVFKQLADADSRKNPQLVIVDGAQGGQSADRTATVDARFWKVIQQRLQSAGVSAQQVQVAWIKQATPGPKQPFPKEAKKLQKHLKTNLHIMQERYPNLKLVYLSSRIYAGYASTRLNPEPHAYETAFAVKWVIEDQIEGDAELNTDPTRGKVKAAWLAWGPYLWADGLKPRSDGLVWKCEEFASDGTHPGPAARKKVATMLLKFFQGDPTTTPWFLKTKAGTNEK